MLYFSPLQHILSYGPIPNGYFLSSQLTEKKNFAEILIGFIIEHRLSENIAFLIAAQGEPSLRAPPSSDDRATCFTLHWLCTSLFMLLCPQFPTFRSHSNSALGRQPTASTLAQTFITSCLSYPNNSSFLSTAY